MLRTVTHGSPIAISKFAYHLLHGQSWFLLCNKEAGAKVKVTATLLLSPCTIPAKRCTKYYKRDSGTHIDL